ncbi:MAG: hypothetical protein J1F33_01300 [Clostridiales bacterium]|nr:hypothetical protein [Clostridiales bacterium]
MKNFYEVQAKCGHVGRGRFFRGTFYVRAYTGSEAAAIVRQMPRVKHDHKDAILSVRQIDKEEYDAGRIERRQNMYYSCVNIQQQRECLDQIEEYIEDEIRPEKNRGEMDKKRQARIRLNNIKNKLLQKYAAAEMAFAG